MRLQGLKATTETIRLSIGSTLVSRGAALAAVGVVIAACVSTTAGGLVVEVINESDRDVTVAITNGLTTDSEAVDSATVPADSDATIRLDAGREWLLRVDGIDVTDSLHASGDTVQRLIIRPDRQVDVIDLGAER